MSNESLTSPRISFSYDLNQQDDHETFQEIPYSSSSLSLDNDFDFCISNNTIVATYASTAEELFLDGKIRPLQLQDKFINSKHESHHSFPPNVNQDCLKEAQTENLDPVKIHQSEFIRRSSSLHCDNTHRRSSFWFSLPLLLLSRSNSTGSVPKVVKENQNQNPKSKNLKNSADIMQSSSIYRKPELKKHYMGYKGNGMRISPVLNVPHPKITGFLHGFGAIFGSDKAKKIKK